MTQQTIDKLRDALASAGRDIWDDTEPDDNELIEFMIGDVAVLYEAAQAALKFIETDGWMPIETIPLDTPCQIKTVKGNVCIGAKGGCMSPRLYQLVIDDEETEANDGYVMSKGGFYDEENQPTHWMPLNPADRLLQMIEGGE